MLASPPIQVAVLGWSDSLILMIMALVVFGPRRLPQIGRQIGKLMYEFRKASNDFKFQMEEEMRQSEETDRRKIEEDRLRSLAAQTPLASASPSSPAAEIAPVEAATPSPYPGEETYPPVAPLEPLPSEIQASTSLEARPPSEGETVAQSAFSPAATAAESASPAAEPTAGEASHG